MAHQLDACILAELFLPAAAKRQFLKKQVRTYLFRHAGRSTKKLLSVPALGEIMQTAKVLRTSNAVCNLASQTETSENFLGLQ